MTILTKLEYKLGACPLASKWAEGKTVKEAWNECKDGAWMIWILARVGLNRKRLVELFQGFTTLKEKEKVYLLSHDTNNCDAARYACWITGGLSTPIPAIGIFLEKETIAKVIRNLVSVDEAEILYSFVEDKMTILTQLEYKLGASSLASKWAEGRTVSEAWSECKSGPWMIWLLARIGFDRKRLVEICQGFTTLKEKEKANLLSYDNSDLDAANYACTIAMSLTMPTGASLEKETIAKIVRNLVSVDEAEKLYIQAKKEIYSASSITEEE